MSTDDAKIRPTGGADSRSFSQHGWRRRLLRAAGMLFVVYWTVFALLLLLENKLLFHPVRASDDWVDPTLVGLPAEDVAFFCQDGTQIHAWWCPDGGDASAGAVLHCHGNAGNLSHRVYQIKDWQKFISLPVLIFDYPGYGKSGGKVGEAGCYAAAEAAFDWLTTTKRIAAEKIILYGDSLGGAVAVQLARTRPHRALVLNRTFTSIPDVAQHLYPFFPARWFIRNRFDCAAKIGECHRPVFIAHGDADRLVPFALGEQLYEKANEPKEFFVMAGADHNDPVPPEFYGHLREFLEKHAK
ncbi:MAG: alpha/beta hydrolase [Gemmatales bacterium]|nr:MAG: alpha/beta hydrolase [Gemmatales bacterium]